MGPKVVQPPEGKIPSVKSIELGGGAQWPSKPITSTPSRHTGSSGGQPPGKSTQGTFNARGRGNKNEQEEEQPHLDPLPEKMVEMEVMVMVVMVEMIMGMMMMRRMMKMTMTMMMKPKQLLRVKVEKTQMHLLVEVHQEDMVAEVMNHHLIWELEMWALEVEGDIEVKEDEEGGWAHKVYQVYRDCKDLRALRE